MRSYLRIAFITTIALTSSISYAEWQPDGIPVGANPNFQTTQTMTSDGAGGVIVTWHEFRAGTGYDIFAQRISASGVPLWVVGGVPVSTVARDQSQPTITSDGVGGAIITWVDDRNCCFNYDIFAQRIDASGASLWTSNGVAICTAAKNQIGPQIVADGAGGGIIVWEDGRIAGLNTDVFAQRINAAGTVQWAGNGVALCTAPNNQYLPKIVSDGAGGAIATWHDFRISGVPDIFAQRINASGTVVWTANGVALSGGPGSNSEYNPVIVADGAGGAIVSWQDFRTGSGDIFAQRINAGGTPQWPSNGVLVSADGWDVNGQIASDGAGGAILTYHIIAGDFESDLFAQRVNGSGVKQWGADGVAIATGTGKQQSSTLVADGFGGGIVAWEDSLEASSSNFDIKAQRISDLGTMQWTAGGIVVCGAVNEQHRAAILSDGAGGAIVSWEDFRNGSNTDIFAMHVNPDGTIPTGIGDTPGMSTLALTSGYPNPFSSEARFTLDLSADANVVAEVFDVAGRRVKHVDLGRMSAGSRAITFNGLGDNGRPLPSGVYFYRVSANGATAVRKMVIAR